MRLFFYYILQKKYIYIYIVFFFLFENKRFYFIIFNLTTTKMLSIFGKGNLQKHAVIFVLYFTKEICVYIYIYIFLFENKRFYFIIFNLTLLKC